MSTPTRGEVLEVPIGDRVRALVGAHIENGTTSPVTPRYAATVMLVRGSRRQQAGEGQVDVDALRVFMLRRASTMAFAPDAEEADAGRVLLLPPTAYNLALLARAEAAESFVLERPEVTRIMLAPKVKADGEVVLSCVLP